MAMMKSRWTSRKLGIPLGNSHKNSSQGTGRPQDHRHHKQQINNEMLMQLGVVATGKNGVDLKSALELVCTHTDIDNNVVHARVSFAALLKEGLQDSQSRLGIALLGIALNNGSKCFDRRRPTCNDASKTKD